MEIERGFARIAEGQVHFRSNVGANGGRPLVLIHMSPVASGFMVPLMEELGDSRRLIAPDTLGNGDSAPPNIENPEIAYFADGLRRALDEMGVDECDLYGVRTGAMIAAELAIADPDRVHRLFIDEITVPSPREITGSYGEQCPPPDAQGRQLDWAFHVMKDHWVFYPWWERKASNRKVWDPRSADMLHDQTVEVLKAIRTFHKSYNAAQRWPREESLAMIRVPTTVFYQPDAEMFPDMRPTAALIPGAEVDSFPHGDLSPAAKAKLLNAWADRD